MEERHMDLYAWIRCIDVKKENQKDLKATNESQRKKKEHDLEESCRVSGLCRLFEQR